jgi:hypothetical protein
LLFDVLFWGPASTKSTSVVDDLAFDTIIHCTILAQCKYLAKDVGLLFL